MGDELDAFSEELRQRPEVRIVNKYALVMAYVRITLKSIGALLLLWATVVLLGGFVSSLKKDDFWTVTIIAFVQAARVFDAMGFAGMDLYWDWLSYVLPYVRSVEKRRREHNKFPMRQWPKKQIQKPVSVLILIITVNVLAILVSAFTVSGPLVCVYLSSRATKKDHGITDGEAIKANMKRALNLFYNAAYAHSFICALWMPAQGVANILLVDIVSRQQGFNSEVLSAYLRKTKQMCVNSRASATCWNLITYGAGLLDSSLPEEYAAGARVLTMLIDKDTPSQIRQLLIRSPRQRIQKLIGTLAWRSPAEQEMRWLAARIVEHLAGDINLGHFPGALECISSLFDQETLLLTSIAPQGTDEDFVLPGLRILENLAHNRHNCTLIYNTKDLLSKIVAPVSSNELIEDIKFSPRWTMVLDGSLKVVSRLMSSPGSTGEEMRNLIANDRNVVNNLEAVMEMDIKSNDSIIKLQMQAMEVLTQLALHHPASASATKTREKLIERALQIFLTADWMEDYLTYEKSRMKEAKETASRLQEKAGEALAMLSSDSEAIKSFTGCDDDVNRLTELLDSNIKTIKCKIGATDTVEIEINIGCRISAAVILKHLKNYVKAPTLRKVLGQLLQDEPFTLQSHIKQCWNRRLQAELLSLVTAIRANNNLNLAGILLSQTPPDTLEDFVVMLKKLVDGNMHATPACLAIQKLTCEMVIEFMKHDRNVEMISNHNIVGTLVNASRKLSRFECSMIFAGIDRDCHGIPLKPRLYVLANKAEDLLTQRKQALGINIVPAGAPIP